jgi:hypothetical protein
MSGDPVARTPIRISSAANKGLVAGLIMSLGYVFVFLVAIKAQLDGYLFSQDPINNPTTSMAAVYMLCQVVGLSLLGWSFNSLVKLWKALLSVLIGMLMAGGVLIVIPIFRAGNLLPFVVYGCVGAALGFLAARRTGAIILLMVSITAYAVAVFGERIIGAGQLIASCVPTGHTDFSGDTSSSATIALSAAQTVINVIFTILVAMVLRLLTWYLHDQKPAPGSGVN